MQVGLHHDIHRFHPVEGGRNIDVSCSPDTIYSSGAVFCSINPPLLSSPPPKERPPGVRKKVLLKNSKKLVGRHRG